METSSLSYPNSQDSISASVIDQLARTKGWVRFFSVVMWLGVISLITGGSSMMMMGMGMFAGVMGSLEDEIGAQFAAMGGIAMLGMFYLALAIIYIYPALKLGKYASRINDLLARPTEQNLAAALNEQRAFWKYLGVLMILMFALYILMFIGIIVVFVLGLAASGM